MKATFTIILKNKDSIDAILKELIFHDLADQPIAKWILETSSFRQSPIEITIKRINK